MGLRSFSLSVTSIVFVDTLHCIRHRTISNPARQMSANVASFANVLLSLFLSNTHTPQSQRETFFVTVTSSNTIPLPLSVSFFLSHHFTSTTLTDLPFAPYCARQPSSRCTPLYSITRKWPNGLPTLWIIFVSCSLSLSLSLFFPLPLSLSLSIMNTQFIEGNRDTFTCAFSSQFNRPNLHRFFFFLLAYFTAASLRLRGTFNVCRENSFSLKNTDFTLSRIFVSRQHLLITVVVLSFSWHVPVLVCTDEIG